MTPAAIIEKRNANEIKPSQNYTDNPISFKSNPVFVSKRSPAGQLISLSPFALEKHKNQQKKHQYFYQYPKEILEHNFYYKPNSMN